MEIGDVAACREREQALALTLQIARREQVDVWVVEGGTPLPLLRTRPGLDVAAVASSDACPR